MSRVKVLSRDRDAFTGGFEHLSNRDKFNNNLIINREILLSRSLASRLSFFVINLVLKKKLFASVFHHYLA